MDVACGEYGDVLTKLVAGIENGKIIYDESSPPGSETPSINQGDSTKWITSIYWNNPN